MNLYFTPRSHFSRKVRLLLDALKLEVELIDVGNVADASTVAFGPNPLMKVPTLIDGEHVVFDSDHIAKYIVQRHDPNDRFNVLTDDISSLNARTVMNGVMSAETELILAARTGMDTSAHRRFDKIRESLCHGLDWLEFHADVFPNEPSYLGFHLTAMWDHLALFDLVPLPHEKLRDRVSKLSSLAYVAASAPRL